MNLAPITDALKEVWTKLPWWLRSRTIWSAVAVVAGPTFSPVILEFAKAEPDGYAFLTALLMVLMRILTQGKIKS